VKIYEKEYFATSEDEALDKAAAHFEVDKDQLEIRKLDGVTIEGLKERQCYVVAVQGMADKQPEAAPRSEGRGRDRGDRGGRDRDRGRGRDRDRGGRDRGRGGRDRDRDRGRGGRGRRPRGDKPEGVDHEHFEAIAQEAVNCVLEDGEDVILDAMNSKERWVVHNFIKNIDGVSSESEGEGAERKIRVFEVEEDDED
jgi:predicted RNA-binding protein Jag